MSIPVNPGPDIPSPIPPVPPIGQPDPSPDEPDPDPVPGDKPEPNPDLPSIPTLLPELGTFFVIVSARRNTLRQMSTTS